MKQREFDMAVIEIKNLSKQYEFYRKTPGLLGSLKTFFYRTIEYADAIKNIDFSVDHGELVGFLGPNGAGKTTTLKILSGILEPTGGTARVLGFDPWKRENKYKRQFGLVMGQKSQLFSTLPAMETFIMHAAIHDIPEREFRASLLELTELFDVADILDIQAKKLSLGQRMKCELILTLLHKPKVLFLDEPTIGLDVTAQKQIREFIKRYNREKGTTILLTSHYMQDIRELCERVIIMNLGKIIYDGKLEKLIAHYAPYKVIKMSFDKPVSPGSVQKYGILESFEPYACTIRIQRQKAKETAALILASNLPVDDILIDEVDVDDVIRTIFAE